MARTAEQISPLEFLQLVAEPRRWQLLRELTRSDRRVGELTELLAEPQNLVSYHLGELRRAGLVSARQSSADRRDNYYRVELQRCGEFFCSAGEALDSVLRLGPLPPEPVKIRGGPAPKVLFLCRGNSARSQMAEALLDHLSGQRIRARSGGSHPKPLHPNAVRVMAERGIDISGRRSKNLSRFVGTRFDRVITLCDKVREVCPEFPGQPTIAHWSMADPAAEGNSDGDTYAVCQRTAHEIENRIGLLIAQMTVSRRKEKPHEH